MQRTVRSTVFMGKIETHGQDGAYQSPKYQRIPRFSFSIEIDFQD